MKTRNPAGFQITHQMSFSSLPPFWKCISKQNSSIATFPRPHVQEGLTPMMVVVTTECNDLSQHMNSRNCLIPNQTTGPSGPYCLFRLAGSRVEDFGPSGSVLVKWRLCAGSISARFLLLFSTRNIFTSPKAILLFSLQSFGGSKM